MPKHENGEWEGNDALWESMFNSGIYFIQIHDDNVQQLISVWANREVFWNSLQFFFLCAHTFKMFGSIFFSVRKSLIFSENIWNSFTFILFVKTLKSALTLHQSCFGCIIHRFVPFRKCDGNLRRIFEDDFVHTLALVIRWPS